MSENRIEILTGAAVLAVAVGFLVWAGQGQGYIGNTGGYTVNASFRSVQGVAPGTDVRMSGVKVGTVRNVALDAKTFFADTTFSIYNGIEIPEDSQMVITSDGLMGGAYVEILPGGALENVQPGGEISDTQGAVSLLGLMMKFVGSSGDDEAPAAHTSTDAQP